MSSTWPMIAIPVVSSLFGSVGFGQTYTVTDLGTLGGHETIPLGINNSGQIVGMAWLPNSGYFHAVRWQFGVIEDLHSGDGLDSWAHAINDAGTVVGWQEPGPGMLGRPVIFAGGQFIDLGTLGGPGGTPRG